MGLPELNKGLGYVLAMCKTQVIRPGAAGRLCSDQGCFLQLSRLRMLSKKNFCGAQGRCLQTWGSEVQSHNKYDIVLVTPCSELEVILGMSLPVPVTL